MLLMSILCDGIGLSPSAAMPIATVLLFAWNYAFANWAILGWNLGPAKVSAVQGD